MEYEIHASNLLVQLKFYFVFCRERLSPLCTIAIHELRANSIGTVDSSNVGGEALISDASMHVTLRRERTAKAESNFLVTQPQKGTRRFRELVVCIDIYVCLFFTYIIVCVPFIIVFMLILVVLSDPSGACHFALQSFKSFSSTKNAVPFMTSRDDAKEVAQILTEGKYDLPMFLAYLKNFAMDGAQPDKSILLGILMQSLARFNTSDFTACMCLVATHVQETSSVEKELDSIYELENFLSCGQFAKFWTRWSKVKENLPESFNFETRVRTSILETIAFTMENISVADLAVYLSTTPDQVPKIVETAKRQSSEFEVQSCTNDRVSFTSNVFNSPQSSINQDVLRFSDVVQIIQ
eukprot:gene1577-960_t